ncbi:MAG: leucine-rich repeat domain-containing protein [Clostridia bacterium]|nr:leucine-rich repeat domain-containing protein [Clostridia bacterium]
MKKTLSTVLYLIIAFSSLLTCAGCSQNDMVVYTLSNDQTHYVVSGLDYDPDEKPTRLNLSIKSQIDGIPVTEIGNDAFNGENLEKITLPSTITKIGDNAFFGCKYLQRIDLPDALTHIGNQAFVGCSLIELLHVGGNVDFIGEYAFQNCTSLSSVVFEEGATTLGTYTFNNCANLVYVTIPSTIDTIGWGVFSDCFNLRDTQFLPDSIHTIDGWAFSNCSLLETLYLPESLKVIGEYAFYGCNLTSVVLDEGLEYIGDGAFEYNLTLSEFSLPNGIKHIGANIIFDTAFYSNPDNWQTVSNGSGNVRGGLYVNDYLLTVDYSYTGLYTVEDGTVLIATGALYSTNVIGFVIPESVIYLCENAIDYNRFLFAVYCRVAQQPDTWEDGWNHVDNVTPQFGYVD